jgi:hypothetical protein
MTLVEKIRACHEALAAAAIPHAFGGALALAWCTGSARGTIDIDVNLFVGKEHIQTVLDALPGEVSWTAADIKRLKRDMQHRLWWQQTPLDLFFNSTDFHQGLLERIHWEDFAGIKVPFVSCQDLAVFKVFFDRTKDWAGLEAMQQAGTLDAPFVAEVIGHYLGDDDPRLQRLQAIADPNN